jgi:integrase
VAAQAAAITFAEAGADYIKAHRAGWRSDKHLRQWSSSLSNVAYPALGNMPVDAIGVADVLRVLTPIWTTTPATANRVRNRVELILDVAKARGLRSGENPAQWRGHLDKLLPARSKVRTVKHFAAIDYREIGAFMKTLRQQSGPAPAALEFAILTACRSGEAMGAMWREIDFDQKLWTVPAERTKARKQHRVPLSDPSLAILAEMAAIRMNDYIFPGQRGRLSPRMLQLTLQRTGREGITVHGFRSTFRDWAGNETNFPREIAEAALAHATGDAVERAYRRGDALDKRRALMDAWAAHCFPTSAEIVPFRQAKGRPV